MLALTLPMGCTTDPLSSGTQALEASPVLVLHRRVWSAPQGADGPPLYSVAWRLPDGTHEPAGLGAPALAAVSWNDAIVWLDAERRLHLRDDRDTILGESHGAPDVRGDALAYALVVGGETEVHLRTPEADRSLGRVYQVGALRIAPEGDVVVGVGSDNGGVVGVWAFDDEGARCLTNCTLRTGEAWTDVVRPPGGAGALRFEGGVVRWEGGAARYLRGDAQ